VRIAEDDPQARAVYLVVTRADGAGKLREFERERRGVSEIEIRVLRRVSLEWRMSEEIHQHAAGVIHKIAKALTNENGVNIAGRGLVELEQIVIGQRFFERNFNRRRRLVFIGNYADRHGPKVLHHHGYFG
jgi:hypothetical protein